MVPMLCLLRCACCPVCCSAESGVITLTSFISPYRADRDKVRARMAAGARVPPLLLPQLCFLFFLPQPARLDNLVAAADCGACGTCVAAPQARYLIA